MTTMRVDVAIIGGGVAGLWLLARLRRLGYSALLLENRALGCGQSILTQAILHGGPAYAPPAGGAEQDGIASTMPPVWNDCLAGTGVPDLSAVTPLSRHHYVWVTPPRRSWPLRWLAPRRNPLPGAAQPAADERPAVLNDSRLQGRLYRLDEPVLDAASLLRALAIDHWEAILLHQGAIKQALDGGITLRAPEREAPVIRPDWCVFTAGAGTAALTWAPLRLRPWHMVLVRGDQLPTDCYLQCLDQEPEPALTITSHADAQGRTVWYLGGRLARAGIRLKTQEQIQAARQELQRRLPWIELRNVQFATLRINRVDSARAAEAGAPFGLFRTGHLIAAWPVTLASTPLLVDAVITTLQRGGLKPRPADLAPLDDWPRPVIAAYPWDGERLQWQ